jgi:hypothetical protein
MTVVGTDSIAKGQILQGTKRLQSEGSKIHRG